MTTKLISTLLLALLFSTVQAREAISWEQLDAAEQKVLQPYAERWDSIDPEQRQRLQKGADRWAAMDNDERKAARERFQRWQQLPETQKQLIRERYERFKQLDPEQQQRLRERMERFKQLPPERRQALRERWQAESAESLQPKKRAEIPAPQSEASAPVQEKIQAPDEAGDQENSAEPSTLIPNQQPNRGAGDRIDRRGMERIQRGGGR
ncbi:MAG: DUF3106 domain-containing protein [Pseudomonadota bacterium]